jgi:hypothetical protein
MDSFPGNSNKAQTPKPKPKEEKVIQKITTGEVIQKKKPLSERFKSVFFGADLKQVVHYVGVDVMLPALKSMVFETVKAGTERAIWGDNGPRRRQMPDQQRPRVSYNSPIDRGFSRGVHLPQQPTHYVGNRRRQSVGDIILASRSEAEMIVERMTDIIDKYDVVSIADLYQMCGLPSTYIDNEWGWSSLQYIDVRQTREGYIIDLPAAEAL